MGTPFTSIFDEFMLLQDDYRLITLFQTSPENFTTYLTGWLKPAVTDFIPVCDQDLTYNLTFKTFNVVLTEKNILYLAKIMKQYWLQKTIDDVSQMKAKIQTDFHTYSEAQNYKTMQDRGILMAEEISQILVKYSLGETTTWDFLKAVNG